MPGTALNTLHILFSPYDNFTRSVSHESHLTEDDTETQLQQSAHVSWAVMMYRVSQTNSRAYPPKHYDRDQSFPAGSFSD